jgi:hypothetical protein
MNTCKNNSNKIKRNKPNMSDIFVRPFTKEGYRVQLDPKPNKHTADLILKSIAAEWDDWKNEYKREIAKKLRIPFKGLTFESDELPWAHWERATRVLDFPLLRCHIDEDNLIETRLCMALCTGKGTSKFWCRTGPGALKKKRSSKIGFDQLENTFSLWHKITEFSCLWMLDKFRNSLKRNTPLSPLWKCEIKELGWLDISCLGVKDRQLAAYFEDLLQDRQDIHKLLSDPTVYDRFIQYFLRAYGIKDIKTKKDQKYPFWFKSIQPVRIDNGTTQDREVMYFMDVKGNKTRAAGIVYDDSMDGEIAHNSVIDVSRYIGVEV